MQAKLDLRCVLISDPSTLGAGAKTRLHTPKDVTYREQTHYCRFMIGHSLVRMESRIKKVTPHCVCRPLGYRALSYATLCLQAFFKTGKKEEEFITLAILLQVW